MTREYVCIRPARSTAIYKEKYGLVAPDCEFNTCPMNKHKFKFYINALACSYLRSKHGPPRPGATTIIHSSRITEYDMTQAKLNFHNRRGRHTCASEGCNHRLEVGDRVVTLHAPLKRDGKGRDTNGTRIYCVACAKERLII